MSEARPKVIHIHDAPEGWQNDPQYVYIGRAVTRRRLRESPLHNPFKIKGDYTREHAVADFKAWNASVTRNDPARVDLIKSLAGKTLVCWCKPEACHGDVLADLCDELWSSILRSGPHLLPYRAP